MTRDEIIKSVKETITFSTPRKETPGGQTTGKVDSTVICICDEINTKISIGCYRTQLQNKDLALTLMHLAIDENFK